IASVTRDNDQTIDERRGSDEAVFDRHRASGSTKIREQRRPRQAHGRFPRQAMKPLHPGVEPSLESGALPSLRQQEDAEAHFAEDDGVDGDLALVSPQPLDHLEVWYWPRRFAEDVGVDQVFHSASEDSDSMGTKYPFSGHARSQSTTPSFGGAESR